MDDIINQYNSGDLISIHKLIAKTGLDKVTVSLKLNTLAKHKIVKELLFVTCPNCGNSFMIDSISSLPISCSKCNCKLQLIDSRVVFRKT